MTVKRVAIIGTGVSGLSAIKSCLEDGLEPVAFDKELDIGGVWHYTPQDDGRRVCVFDSVHSTTNRVSSSFSDFPYSDDLPLYPSHRSVKEYLKQYADNFKLSQHIKFDSEVISVENDDTQARRWKVKWRSDVGDVKCESFDSVIVCSGLFSKPYFPSIPGLDQFKGTLIHGGHYRTQESFKKKRVVIIGFGNSGSDIACTLGENSSEVYLATGNGAWVIPRVWAFNRPFEWVFGNRFVNSLGPLAPIYFRFCEFFSQIIFDFAGLGILPDRPMSATIPVAGEDFIQKVSYGMVKLRPTVTKVDESAVYFKDGTRQEADAIVLATGYEPSLSFLGRELLPWKGEGLSSLYKHIFPTSPMLEGLCFVGIFNVAGPTIRLCELQARIVSAVLSGRMNLPEKHAMVTWVSNAFAKVDRSTFRGHFPVLNWIQFEEELATFLGVQPRPWKTLLTDFELGKALLFNTPSASVYRLTGPNQWAGAREVVINADETMKKAMSPMKGDSCLNLVFQKLFKVIGYFFAFTFAILLIGILIGIYL